MAKRAVCYSSFPQGGNGCSPPEALEETIRIHTSRMLYREKDPGRGRAFLLVRAGNMSRACPRVTQIWA